MKDLLENLLVWITLHPNLSGLIIFTIALLESLVVVGLLIPGAVLLFGVGALIAQGALPLVPTIAWTALGAITGDMISFLLGVHYHQRLRVLWPLKRYPALVNQGIDFFYRHGGKSVFMARFVGPVRPIIPAIAGMMNMGVVRFLAVDVIAAAAWAPAYILPGMVFGASLELAAEVAGRLVVLLVVVLGIAWLSVGVIRGMIRLVQPHAATLLERVLEWSRNHPRIRPLAGSLLDPDHPEARGLATLSGLSFLTFWLLLLITEQVFTGTLLENVNHYLFNYLNELRTPWADRVMVFVTLFGGQLFLGLLVTTGSAWLIWKGYIKAAVHWLAVYACTGIMVYVFKATAQIERPVDFYGGFSFPSAHTTMSLVVYGFLALLIARELPIRRRWLPYSIAALLVVSIALSRMYLGVHWFSDILGGASMGLFWVALIGIAYDRHPAPALPFRRLGLVMALVLLVAGAWQTRVAFENELVRYTPRFNVQQVTLAEWEENYWRELPITRIDMEGAREQPLNVQWAGSLYTLKAVMMEHGWLTAPELGPGGILNWLAPKPDITRLPILPQVHDGQHQELLLVKQDPASMDHLMALRLWRANAEIRDTGERLWVGNVSYLIINQTLQLLSFLKTGTDFDAPMAAIQDSLSKAEAIRFVRRNAGSQPANKGTSWNGDVLLVWVAVP